MLEIRNKTPGPINLTVRSFSDKRVHTNAMTCKVLPGREKCILEDEQVVNTYIERYKKWGLIATKYIPNTRVKEKKSDRGD